MIKLVKQNKQNIIFNVEGKLQIDDYAVLTPTIDKAIKEYGYVNLMLVDKGFKGETARAIGKDMKFGFNSYSGVKKLAVVSDKEWIRMAVNMMSPFTKTEEKIFGLDEQDEARSWLES
ncbi:STAS/SEC14 domain-containing protein [Candidatus Saccharibacteria bacterium]|nr:STAS/SEC14 domain-containing protein [Candidatus Saccharibacteria bacterium]